MLASAADWRRARVFSSVMRPGRASAGIQLAPRREDRAAVDVDGEAAAGGVGLGDEADVAQGEGHGAGGVAEPDHEVVDRLRAHPGRPPQRRVGEGQLGEEGDEAVLGDGLAGHGDAAEADAPGDVLRPDAGGGDLDVEGDAARCVALGDGDLVDQPAGPTMPTRPRMPAGARAMLQSQPKSHWGLRSMLPFGIVQLSVL